MNKEFTSIVISVIFSFSSMTPALAQEAPAAGQDSDQSSLVSIADKGFLEFSMKWIDDRSLGWRGKFSYLWQSYEEEPTHPYSEYIAMYKRTWVYDDALAIYAQLKTAELAKATGDHESAQRHIENARRATEAFVYLADWEESKGFNGLWHFSYNVFGDNFIDPRGPLGADIWVLNAIYSYIIQTADTRHLGWINHKVKNFIFGQQVMDEKDPRHGLIRAGLYNASDYAKGDSMGYNVYGDDPNVQNENCFVEHNADYIGLLRLAAIAEIGFNESRDKGFLDELKNRHEACLKAVIKNFWQDDHFSTGMSETGKVNTSVAVDNNSWLADVIMVYDMERAWQSLQFNEKRFIIELELGRQKAEGLFFFTRDFHDMFIQKLRRKDREKLEKMIQPEATFGYIALLMRYARYTKDEARRQKCLELVERLYSSMIKIKKHYGSRKLPYATLDIKGYFNTMGSMASIATGAVVTAAMLGANADDFIGVAPPAYFTVDEKPPIVSAKIRIVPSKARPLLSIEPGEPGKRTVFTIEDAKADSVSAKVSIKLLSFTPGKIVLKIIAPRQVLENNVLTVWMMKDAWYRQPGGKSKFRINLDGAAEIEFPRKNLEKGKCWILMVDDSKLSEIPPYFSEWQFDKIAPHLIEGLEF